MHMYVYGIIFYPVKYLCLHFFGFYLRYMFYGNDISSELFIFVFLYDCLLLSVIHKKHDDDLFHI